ncbi:MAG: hypothetical protein HY422_00030 [Candidatus Komeilibacteria bacterium]|nr:hypothetical protein [Candidatus Komeilibacteria bacterium]
MIHALGGGIDRQIVIERDAKSVFLIARAGIFGIFLCIVTHPSKYAGMFLVPNWERSKQKTLANPDTARRQPEWQIVPSVYAAYRQTVHILHQYGAKLNEGEKQLLIQARETALQLNLRALGKGGRTPIARVHESLQGLIMQIADPLKHVRNVYKLEARRQVLAMLGGNGEPINRPAARARAVAARTELQNRVDEIMRIEPHILGRQQVLLSLIHLAELYLEVTKDFLDKLLEFDGFKPLFEYPRRIVIADHLEFLAQELVTLEFNPYREMCLRSVEDMRSARDTLRLKRLSREDWQRFRELLKRCDIAITIKNIQVRIERSILHLTKFQHEGGTLPTGVTLLEIQTLIQELLDCHDSILEKPVCTTALGHLDAAKHLLLNNDTSPKFKELKESIKQASAAL